ncbi:MAG: histidine kinase, partial [Proteobacteria bacterium]
MQEYKDWHPNFPVNLRNCEDEPIRIPGAIQKFGFLLAFDPVTRQIVAYSENALEHFPQLTEISKQNILLESLLTLEDSKLIDQMTAQFSRRKLTRVTFDPLYGAAQCLAVLFAAGPNLVLEVETTDHSDRSKPNYLADLHSVMRDVQNLSTEDELATFTVNTIKQVSGFDRVMFYKYDEDWNGEVIAEAKEEKLETFLGLHYPASDIPAQARALYERNWIRIIPTIHYRPILIQPAAM